MGYRSPEKMGLHLRPFLIAALWAVSISSAQAQSVGNCGPDPAVVEYLAKNHRERPAERGISKNGLMVRLFAADDGATWTVVVTTPHGTSCIIAAGEDWQAIPMPRGKRS